MGVSDAIVGLGERAGRGKRFVCMDGFDLYEMLQRSLPFDHVIDGKVRYCGCIVFGQRYPNRLRVKVLTKSGPRFEPDR